MKLLLTRAAARIATPDDLALGVSQKKLCLTQFRRAVRLVARSNRRGLHLRLVSVPSREQRIRRSGKSRLSFAIPEHLF